MATSKQKKLHVFYAWQADLQLTFLLFLKMADEQSRPPFNKPSAVPQNYAWSMRFLWALLVIWSLCLSATASAATLRVPGQYANIQGAINSAGAGDAVLVAPGTYFENISFQGKAITVISEAGADATILDGRRAGAVVTFRSGETRNSVLSGFTLRNGYADYGSGVSVADASATIVSNVFENNDMVVGRWGAAIGGNTASPVIEKNIFRHNSTDDGILSGVVSFINECSPRIANNVFYDNPGRALAMRLNLNADPLVINNTIVRNRRAIRVDGGSSPLTHSFYNNLIAENVIGVEIESGPSLIWMNNLVGGNGTDYLGIADQAGTNGNISGRPSFWCFRLGATPDLRLLPGSVGIDTGYNSTPQLPVDDFEGHNRILAGKTDGLPVADIGAFEFDPSVPIHMCDAPRITLLGPDSATNECHTAFVDPGVSISDVPVAIAAGWAHSLALKADGSVVAWGANFAGQTNVPANLGQVVAVSANGNFSLALKTDGTVAAWGDGTDGETNVPTSATNVAAISAGGYHGLALKRDGSVVAWGHAAANPVIDVPASATNVIAIAGGREFSVALRANGTVLAWGFSQSGETNVPPAASNVIAIAAGDHHGLALRNDGTVVTWGYDDQFGSMRVPTRATNVIAVSAADFISMALRADGTVVVWGRDDRAGVIVVPPSATNVIGIAVGGELGGDFCFALKTDGSAVGWGQNGSGQTAVPQGLTDLHLPYATTGTLDTEAPGTYALTYVATNILNEVGMATRTIVVVDRTPPLIACPTNRIIDFTNAAGAVVFFAVEASDFCSPTVSLVYEPASGSVFPVGTSAVTCVATDASGNSTQCSFEITVLGAVSIKADVLNKLEERADAIGNSEAALRRAINRLRRSISTDHWLDETHVKKGEATGVFLNEATAVRHLKSLLRAPHGIPVGEDTQQWIDRLVTVDRTMAQLAIDEAIEAGVERNKIQAASEKITAGDHAQSRRRSVGAILLYRDAWRIATRAISRLPTA